MHSGKMARTMSNAADLICAALRGEFPAWPQGQDAKRFLADVRTHAVAALLHQYSSRLPWPGEVLEPVRAEAISHAMWEMRHQAIIAAALDAFAREGIEPIILKGTALAYSIYGDAALRVRGDTDLLIAPSARQKTHDVLCSLGFLRADDAGGEYASYQASYSAPGHETHHFDLHWKINNSEVLAQLFTYEELRSEARAIPSLSPHALGTSLAHSLLVACMHRGTHRQNPYYVDNVAHYEADRIIWLYDIHLLATVFQRADWEHAAQLAHRKGMRAVCLESLLASQERFGTEVPKDVLSKLKTSPSIEAPALYLASSKLRQQWMDFRALKMTARWRWLREVLFPDRAYMLRKYKGTRRYWLPWLYAKRAVGGVVRTLLRSRARFDHNRSEPS